MISTQAGQPSLARGDSGPTPRASKKVEHLPFTKKGSRPAPQAPKKRRRVPRRLRAPRVGVEDFVPWVSPISSLPPAREEEEEEDEMDDLVHNFAAWKRKRGASFKQAAGVTTELAGEASQPPSGERLDVQVIVISGSPDMGFHGQSASEIAPLVDLGEVSPTPVEAREDNPPEQITNRTDRAKATWAGRSRPLLHDRLLLNSYIPP